MPDPDLVVRTSGEFRISNFLLWELAYRELVFTEVLWPDFRRENLADGRSRVPEPRSPLRRCRAPGVVTCRSMSPLYRDTGIVLRTYKFGEADRIVVLLTETTARSAPSPRESQGDVQVRRATRTDVPRCCRSCAAGRISTRSPRPKPPSSFHPLRTDLDRLTAGAALLEAVDLVSEERQPNDRLYRMLLGALRTLAAQRSALLVPAFHLKLLAAEGSGRSSTSCVVCDAPGPLVAFDLDHGGAAVPDLPAGACRCPRSRSTWPARC